MVRGFPIKNIGTERGSGLGKNDEKLKKKLQNAKENRKKRKKGRKIEKKDAKRCALCDVFSKSGKDAAWSPAVCQDRNRPGMTNQMKLMEVG